MPEDAGSHLITARNSQKEWIETKFLNLHQKDSLIIYWESELVSEQKDVQHLLHQYLITNPNAIRGKPKLLKQPQHVLQAVTVQALPIKAKLNKYEPKKNGKGGLVRQNNIY